MAFAEEGAFEWALTLSAGQSVEIFIPAKDSDKSKKGKAGDGGTDSAKKGGAWFR
jgi:hypothetical protein